MTVQNINNHIEVQLNWRQAVKSFDNKKSIPTKDFQTIIESIRLSPSSMGLQPWKLLVIKSNEVKQKLANTTPANRTKFETAPCILIFARLNQLTPEYINRHIDFVKQVRMQTEDDVAPLYRMLSSKLKLAKGDFNNWTSKQTYIALGSGIMSAALLHIDTCPMEGINAAAFDEILGLSDSPYSTTVALALGYRSQNAPGAQLRKVRYSENQIVQMI